jgi:hypothetical protein
VAEKLSEIYIRNARMISVVRSKAEGVLTHVYKPKYMSEISKNPAKK